MMAGKNTFLDHNISCNMDMINEFSEGVSGLFMNAQDILSESQGILSSIEGIAGSIPGEARYAGLIDSIHGCLSKIRMCDMGAIGFQIIGKTNNYVENMYSIDREYAEKIRKSNWNVIKERLSGVAGSNVYSSNPNSVSGNSSSEKDVVLQKKLDKLQYYDKVYNHVQDQKGRDYYQAKMNEYFNAEIQPLLSQKIVIADNMTCKYCMSEEITIGKVYDAWDDVLNISKYCGNVATYNNTYRELNSNINKIRIQVLDTANTKSVKKISNQIARTNEKYVFNPIVPGGKLDNDFRELKRMQQTQSHILDEAGKQSYQRQIVEYIRKVISFHVADNLSIILADLKNYSVKSDIAKYDSTEMAIVKLVVEECKGYDEFNDIYMDVPDRVEKLVLQKRMHGNESNEEIQKEISNIDLFLTIPVIDEKGNIIRRNGLKEKVLSTEKWDEEKIYTANMLTRMMALEGYEQEFICGMVGNITYESGRFGKFEDMHFVNSIPKKYQKHMNEKHDFDNLYGNSTLEEIGLAAYGELLNDPRCKRDENHMFGIGCVQWTDHHRSEGLYNLYVSKYGEDYYPDARECASVELEYVITELRGEKSGVYSKWKSDSNGVNKEESIYFATKQIMEKYEVTDANTFEIRNAYAQDWRMIFDEK